MNKAELRKILTTKKISRSLYSLDGGLPNEKLCMSNDGDEWTIYYSEKGTKNVIERFDNEEDACNLLYEKVMKIVLGEVR